ncbi:MAG: hypothetical protein FWC09_01655 [Lachnospiraceae bacterium]|nr:hypothetical protein [Lachnospiraceae bacterium]
MKSRLTALCKQLLVFISENLMLVGILVCVTLSILSRAYFDLSYISPDSAHYLRAAREILRGNGFYVYPEWFGIWPLGYPFLIAVTAFVTRAEVYLASKILSIIIVWIIGIMLYKRFNRIAWAYAFVMFNVGFRYIFFYTWSETAFILGMFLLAFVTVDIICDETVKASHYIRLTFASLLMFLSRYIGAFALIVIGVLWLTFLFRRIKLKDKLSGKRVLYLTAAGAVTGIFIISYLLLNQRMTGYMTGTPRVPAGHLRDTLLELYRAMMIEMDYVFDTFIAIGPLRAALLLWVFFIGFLFYSFARHKEGLAQNDRAVITPLVFILIGVVYWLAIVAMRLSAHFDDFDFRLLFPSSAMLFIGFVGLLTLNDRIKQFFKLYSAKIIPVLCLCGFIMMMLVITPRLSGTSGYRQTRDHVLSVYAGIPDGAVVLWGDTLHLMFLRDNVDSVHVDLSSDDIAGFWETLKDYDEIYINIPAMKKHLDEYDGFAGELYGYFYHYRESGEMLEKLR